MQLDECTADAQKGEVGGTRPERTDTFDRRMAQCMKPTSEWVVSVEALTDSLVNIRRSGLHSVYLSLYVSNVTSTLPTMKRNSYHGLIAKAKRRGLHID